jgi:hypothetical protein
VRITQSGAEFCRLSPQDGLVLVSIPFTIEQEADESTNLLLVSRMGSFERRPEHWSATSVGTVSLTFRLPSQVVREGEHAAFRIFQVQQPIGTKLLWARDYEAHWIDNLPELEPVLDDKVLPCPG